MLKCLATELFLKNCTSYPYFLMTTDDPLKSELDSVGMINLSYKYTNCWGVVLIFALFGNDFFPL